MPVPELPRSRVQQTARAAARAAPGLLGGSRAGLAPVRRGPTGSPRRLSVDAEWVYDDYQSANFVFTAGGTVAAGATANINTLSSTSGGAYPWYSTTATSVTILREGIYYVQYDLSLTGALGVGYVRALYGLTGRDFFPEPGALPRNGIDSEVMTPISIGKTLGPSADAALSLLNKTTNTLTLGANLTVGIVAVLLA